MLTKGVGDLENTHTLVYIFIQRPITGVPCAPSERDCWPCKTRRPNFPAYHAHRELHGRSFEGEAGAKAARRTCQTHTTPLDDACERNEFICPTKKFEINCQFPCAKTSGSANPQPSAYVERLGQRVSAFAPLQMCPETTCWLGGGAYIPPTKKASGLHCREAHEGHRSHPLAM